MFLVAAWVYGYGFRGDIPASENYQLEIERMLLLKPQVNFHLCR